MLGDIVTSCLHFNDNNKIIRIYKYNLSLPLHQQAEAGADRLVGGGLVDLLQPVLGTAARGVVRQALVQVVGHGVLGLLGTELSSLIGPDHSGYSALIGPDHSRYWALIGGT